MNAWALNAADVGPLEFLVLLAIATAGAMLIHWWQRRSVVSPTLDSARIVERPVSGPEDPEIVARMQELSRRMGLPEEVLPIAHAPGGHPDGDFVWQEGTAFRYRSLERGAPVADHVEPRLDELLFHVFRDRSRMRAYIATISVDEAEREAEIAKRQRAMLTAGDQAWAERLDA